MAKWSMRALFVLSVASMALAVAPMAGASPSPTQNAPATSSGRYGDSGSCGGLTSQSQSRTSTSTSTTCCNTGRSLTSSFGISSFGSSFTHPSCPVAICHYNRDDDSYTELTVNRYGLLYLIHLFFHPSDIIPAPVDGCPDPGYTPPASSGPQGFLKTDDTVEFSLNGCPQGSQVQVAISGVAVGGSPFTVPSNDLLRTAVAAPGVAAGDVLQVTCDTPHIAWETEISSASELTVSTAASAPKPLALSNPAKAAAVSNVFSSGSASGGSSVPARQLGFGLAAAFGLVAFGGLRHRTQTRTHS